MNGFLVVTAISSICRWRMIIRLSSPRKVPTRCKAQKALEAGHRLKSQQLLDVRQSGLEHGVVYSHPYAKVIRHVEKPARDRGCLIFRAQTGQELINVAIVQAQDRGCAEIGLWRRDVGVVRQKRA